MSRWFRHYAGMCIDPKFGGIARRARVTRERALFVWCLILESAAERDATGLFDWDADAVAEILNCDTDDIRRVHAELIAAEMIDAEGRVSRWQTRQYESDKDKTNAERQARYRDRTKAKGAVTDDALNASNGPVTPLRNEGNGPHSTENRDTISNEIVARETAPKPRAVRAKSRTAIDPDLKPTLDDARVARDHGMSGPDMAREWPAFKNHHLAKGSLMADWPAAWRTWCGNFRKFGQARGSPRQPAGSFMAQVASGAYFEDTPDDQSSREHQPSEGPDDAKPRLFGFDRNVSEPGRDDGGGSLLDLRAADAGWR